MTTQPASPELEDFIRNRLGCGCPAQVFEQIGQSPTARSLAAGVSRRIDVGGRLLIYVIEPGNADHAIDRLPDWIAAGRAERDGNGMNRLRLVLAPAHSDARQIASLKRCFDAVADGDDRLHLHIIDPALLPGR